MFPKLIVEFVTLEGERLIWVARRMPGALLLSWYVGEWINEAIGWRKISGLWTFRTLYESRVLCAMLLEMLFILTSAGHSLSLICLARNLGKPSVDVVI